MKRGHKRFTPMIYYIYHIWYILFIFMSICINNDLVGQEFVLTPPLNNVSWSIDQPIDTSSSNNRLTSEGLAHRLIKGDMFHLNINSGLARFYNLTAWPDITRQATKYSTYKKRYSMEYPSLNSTVQSSTDFKDTLFSSRIVLHCIKNYNHCDCVDTDLKTSSTLTFLWTCPIVV